jgi:hypothetical protein
MPHSRTRRGNRLGLALVGIILFIGGSAAVARGAGLFGRAELGRHAVDAGARLLTVSETRYVDHAGWLWSVVAALAVLVALLCLRWLVVQARVERAGLLQVEADRTYGATTVDTSALVDAVEQEIAGYPGVARVRGRLSGDLASPELHLVIGLEEHASPPRIRQRVTDSALAHLRQALELDALPTRITLRVDAAGRRRRLT